MSEVDVLVPCALGGLFDDETVPRLRCRVVAGAANNQLADDHVADLLQARGILWAPDFVVNAGGLINIAEELGGYDAARWPGAAWARSPTRCMRSSPGRRPRPMTPLAAAMHLARSRLAIGNGAPRGSSRPRADGSGILLSRNADAPPRPGAGPRPRACRGGRPA